MQSLQCLIRKDFGRDVQGSSMADTGWEAVEKTERPIKLAAWVFHKSMSGCGSSPEAV